MKLGWSIAVIGVTVALGLNPARAENEFLAPVVNVMGDGGATVMPVGGQAENCGGGGGNCGSTCDNGCGKSCVVYTPQMIGMDLPTNVYAGTFVNRPGFGYVLAPQVQRGAFKISDNESPAPTDRAYLAYTYFNHVNAPGAVLVFNVPGAAPGFAFVQRRFETDVHRETFGFEKTFLCGDASIGIRMNVTQEDGDIQYDSFGDTTIIGKYVLIKRENLLGSVGIALTVPTGSQNSGALGAPYRSVLFQPWSAFIWNYERIYVQGFNALISSTNDNDPKIATYDIGIGYRLYQAECCKDVWLNYIIPTVEGHANLPVSKEGFANRIDFAQPDSLIATVGLHVGIGCRTNLTFGAAVPLSGPKLYDVSGMAQLNWRF